MVKQHNLMSSTVKVVYNFLLEPILGCLYGAYVLHIPHGVLGVAVSVPLVVAFFLTQILMSRMPPSYFNARSESPKQTRRSFAARRWVSVLAAIPVAVGLAWGLVMGISSGIYALIGLHDLAAGSFRFSANSLGVALFFSVAYILIGFALSKPVKIVFLVLINKTIHVIWQFICFPNTLSVLISREYGVV